MDVRLLIGWHPGDIYHASVIAVDVARAWHKLYRSKVECVDELGLLGLLTMMEQYDVLHSGFETKDKVFISIAIVEAEALEDAGFVESTPAKLN